MEDMKHYYVDRENKKVYIYREIPKFTTYDFLGSTDNKWVKMAVAKFLKGEMGYKIIQHY